MCVAFCCGIIIGNKREVKMVQNSNKRNIWPLIAICIMIVVLALFIAVWLFGGNTTYIEGSGGAPEDKMATLNCELDGLDVEGEDVDDEADNESGGESDDKKAFFVSKSVQRYNHEIRVVFKNQRPDAWQYHYNGTYNSNDSAEAAEAALHADYNIYMGENDLEQSSLNPVFSTIKSKVQISLYGDEKTITPATARFFFLESDELNNIFDSTIDDLKKDYEDDGFSCTLK